jgi:type I restriction enzyme M protein
MSSQETLDGNEIEEGKVIDFWTGKELNETDEEKVRQEYEEILTKDYGYPEDHCNIEVSVQVGSEVKRADGVIYESADQESAHLILETKRPDKSDGVAQLKTYMKGAARNPGVDWSPEYGVWTNGDETVYLYREPGTDNFTEITNIPSYGESLSDVGQLNKKSDLEPATNLDAVFRQSINYIYGNQGVQRTVAFTELLKLIFVKMYDEQLPDAECKFGVPEVEVESARSSKAVRSQIEPLFEEVKDKYDDVFDENESINLNDDTLTYVVGKLEDYDLLNTDIDVKGSAFENVVGANLKGDRGEFFTPREVVRMTVRMLDIEPVEKVCDPACGSGGFLIEGNKQVRRKIDDAHGDRLGPAELERMKSEAVDEFYGIDFNPELARAAKMNMVMNQGNHWNVVSENSLLPPEEWSSETRQRFSIDLNADDPLGVFEVVITNPPFGADIPIERSDILRQFDLGHKWRKEDGEWKKQNELKAREAPEVLFIERCLDLLEEGGRMGIVIPDGILGNPEAHGYVRKFIEQNAKVLAVVDLPVETFLPQVGARTSVLFLEKHTGGVDEDYEIFMAVAEKTGSDRRGNTIYRTDDKGNYVVEDGERVVANDLPDIVEEYEQFLEGEF